MRNVSGVLNPRTAESMYRDAVLFAIPIGSELFYPRNSQDITIEQFIKVVDSYIRWYNEKRIKISFGSLSPLE